MSAPAHTADEPFDGGPLARRGSRTDGVRLTVALAVVLAALLALAEQESYRVFEARLASRAVHGLLGYPVIPANAGPTFFFGYHSGGGTQYLGLGVSLACSSVLLVGPAALVTAVLAVVSTVKLSRLMLALAATAALVTLINLLRFVLIALLVDAWGPESGFGWAHSFFGSLLTLAGLAGATYLYYRLARRPAAARRQPPAEQ